MIFESTILAALALLVAGLRAHTTKENKRICDKFQCQSEEISRALERSNAGTNNP